MEMVGNFDIDLNFGNIFEDKVRDIFEGRGGIEVKTEREQWKETGNIAIEIFYKGKPSGISTTNADWWIHVLADGDSIETALMFPVSVLKKKIKQKIKSGRCKIVMGGDDNQSKLVLMPISSLAL